MIWITPQILSYRSSSLLDTYNNPQWFDPNTHIPNLNQSTLYSYPNNECTQNPNSNLTDKNSMVIPTQEVVPNNSNNVRSSKHSMMQAQGRSQIIRNYSTMPKFDGIWVDRENIYDWSDRFAAWASINDFRSMKLDFQKKTV